MAGKHITEAVWRNAAKELPKTSRNVLVHYVHYNKGRIEHRLAEARFLTSSPTCFWDVDSKIFDQSIDKIIQWTEIEPQRGGCLPDMFPNSGVIYDFV